MKLIAALTFLLLTPQLGSAAITVFGLESASNPGTYTFTFAQESGVDPIQNRGPIPLNFAFDSTSFAIEAGSPTGSITDGTTTLTAALTGWSDPTGAALSIDPNLIVSPSSVITARSTPGIDFNTTNVEWRFTSAEFFAGAPLVGFVQQATAIPEPSCALALSGLGALLMLRRRRD